MYLYVSGEYRKKSCWSRNSYVTINVTTYVSDLGKHKQLEFI